MGNIIDEALVLVIPAQAGIQTYYFLHDHLYSPDVLINSSGTVVERYEYDAYGTTHFMDPGFGNRTATQYGVTTLFTGRTLDTIDSGALKISYYRHRYTDPFTGRFLQEDPIGILLENQYRFFKPLSQYMDGLSLYQYVFSQPTNYLDPRGLSVAVVPPPRVTRLLFCQCKGTCGPDITHEFYDLLRRTRIYLHQQFQDPAVKATVCGIGGIYHPAGWDISSFFNPWYGYVGKYPSGKACQETVTFAGSCVNKWELNYYYFGFLNRLCGNSKKFMQGFVHLWTATRPDDPYCKSLFADAGYEGGGSISCPLKECSMDKCCSTKNVPKWNQLLQGKIAGTPWGDETPVIPRDGNGRRTRRKSPTDTISTPSATDEWELLGF